MCPEYPRALQIFDEALMRTGTLTDLTIRNLSAPMDKRIELWDAKLPGFGVRVSPQGTKTFVLMYYANGRKRRHTLGRFPHLSLAKARAKAFVTLGQVADGEEVEPATCVGAFHFENVVEAFVEKHCLRHNRASTASETARLLRARFIPLWLSRDIRDITRADVVAVLDAAMKAETPSAANHALSAIRKLFSWCAERELVEANPCSGISRPAPLGSRERALTIDEIAAVWRASSEIGYPFEPLIKLLILTGQRRGEVAGMTWGEVDVDNGLWTIPSSRTKNKKTHSVPLSPSALSLLRSLPRIGHSEFVFAARGNDDHSVSGFSKAKRRLDKIAAIADWTLHDLRRSAATGMAGQATPPHVVEKILNHSSGTFAGVAGIYNRFEYLSEMRVALDRWATRVEQRVLATQQTN